MAKASRSRRSKRSKPSRRATKRTRKSTRRVRRRMRGGGHMAVFPAPVSPATYDASMSAPSKAMLSAGTDYLAKHAGQYGGAAVNLSNSAPPGYTGMLDDSLRGAARVTPLDQSTAAASGMSDQAGGRRRRRRGTYFKNMMRKSSRGLRSFGRGLVRPFLRKSRRGRAMRGGAPLSLAGAQDFGAPGMLLSPSQEAQALQGMNKVEWTLAQDPKSFSPL